MKTKTIYSCQECGYTAGRWLGRCPSCGAWNTFAEESVADVKVVNKAKRSRESKAVPITDVGSSGAERFLTGINGIDQVLGGGIVNGSVILLGGDPGIGKSTMSMQVAGSLAKSGKRILYATGEESSAQVALRAKRLGALHENILLMSETDLSVILKEAKKVKPDLLIIDSIQVIFSPELASAPGTVSQVRQCACQLVDALKPQDISLIIIGHVTKEGALAGPRTLEHLVDVVLYFEGDRFADFRILRGIKNRFGSTNEIAMFEMSSTGLKEVSNPSTFFISHYATNEPGTVAGCVIEGSRPIMLEVQALVSKSSGFGAPYRRAQGFDNNRLTLLIAVLEKVMGFSLYDQDIFVNITGGFKVSDPGVDLAVAMAIISSFLVRPIEGKSVVIGEVGLTGEVRRPSQLEKRISEAGKIGFKNIFAPDKLADIKVHSIQEALLKAGLMV